MFAGIASLCMVLVISELTGGGLNSKSLAALGVLAAMAAVLRTITLPAGANLYFLLIILGYNIGPIRVSHNVADIANIGANRRQPRRHRLDKRNGILLAIRRQSEDVEQADKRRRVAHKPR